MTNSILSDLKVHGFALRQAIGAIGLVSVTEELGRVMHVEEVVVAADSKALLKSAAALSPHTDHHRARWIVWHCLEQSTAGGETLLVDARAVYSAMDPEKQALLSRIQLSEHSVFAGDEQAHPMVSLRHGVPEIYFSLWLVGELPPAERAAFDEFATRVQEAEPINLRLQPGDVLAIDNKRMLHGRSAIRGDGKRHLRRYWLE